MLLRITNQNTIYIHTHTLYTTTQHTEVHCAKVATCACPDIIPYARGFFVVTNLVLLGIYANQWYVAKSLPSTTPERTDDMALLQKKIKKGVLKPLVLGVVHLKFGIMAYVSNQIYIYIIVPHAIAAVLKCPRYNIHIHTTHIHALFSDRGPLFCLLPLFRCVVLLFVCDGGVWGTVLLGA